MARFETRRRDGDPVVPSGRGALPDGNPAGKAIDE
jgi:hypothetical protein